MKNISLNFILIFIGGNICRMGLPWWSLVIIAGIAAMLFPLKPWKGALTAFSAGFLLWFISALLFNIANGGILAARVGQLFNGLGSGQLLAITALLGGVTAALGSLCGNYLGQLFVRKKPKRYKFDY
jgi:hypothetical protein